MFELINFFLNAHLNLMPATRFNKVGTAGKDWETPGACHGLIGNWSQCHYWVQLEHPERSVTSKDGTILWAKNSPTA